MIKALAYDRWFFNIQAVFRLNETLSSIRKVLSAEIIILVITVCTGLITARLLGPDGRGELTAMLLWPGVAAGLLTLGLPRSLTYNVARQCGEASCLVLVGLLASFCIGLVAAALGALVIPLWLRDYPARTIEFAQWAMLAAPAVILMWSISSVLQAWSEFTAYNRNRYVPPLLALVALAGLGLFGVLNPFSAALVMIGSSLPILIGNLIWILRTCRSGCSEPVRSLRQLLSYGMRAYGLDVAQRLSHEIDRVILVGLVSPAAVGIYVVAKSSALPAAKLNVAVATVLFPEASRRGTKQGTQLLGRAACVSGAVTSVAAVGLAVVAPPLIELLYGEAFAPAVGPFRILLVDAVVVGFASILAQAFMSSDRPGVAGVERFLGLLVSALCMLFLVPAFGASGAALAILISSLVRVAFTLLCFPLVLKVRLLSLLPRRQDLEGLLARRRAVGWEDAADMSSLTLRMGTRDIKPAAHCGGPPRVFPGWRLTGRRATPNK